MSAIPRSGAPASSHDLVHRGVARAIDALIVAGAGVALGSQMGFGFDWLLIELVSVYLYFAVLTSRFGATVGKWLLGLRVVTGEGERPTLGQSLRREAFTLVGGVPFVGPLLALGLWIWFAVDIRAHGVARHDRLAGGTRVVFAR